MTPAQSLALESSVHRQTATRPDTWGCWLARHRRRHDLSVYDQARRLKLTEAELAKVALCKVPRVSHLRLDLNEVASMLVVREVWVVELWREIEGPPWGCPHGEDLCGNAYGMYCQRCWEERRRASA